MSVLTFPFTFLLWSLLLIFFVSFLIYLPHTHLAVHPPMPFVPLQSSSLRKKEIIFRTIEPPNTTTCQPHTLWIAHLLQDILGYHQHAPARRPTTAQLIFNKPVKSLLCL
ncbi:hypothetical protein ILYODFUR_018330 [Ilyodon furcidens]|uniref:ATP synthase F0 subunit 8 n=1 Tax=Ilyodon furcidens TaxID=33524 RepID=A0ABV0SZJ0_9TELE